MNRSMLNYLFIAMLFCACSLHGQTIQNAERLSWSERPFFSDTLSVFGRYAYSIGLFTASSVGVHATLVQVKGLDWGTVVRWDRFKLAYTMPPQWDDDSWHYNFVVHPVMGYIGYSAFRNRGGSIGGAFLSTAIGSTLYEYVFAAFTQRPSIQDLVVTPVLGSVLGETAHQIKRYMLRDHHLTFTEKCTLIIIDPIEFLNKKGNFNNYLNLKPEPPQWL